MVALIVLELVLVIFMVVEILVTVLMMGMVVFHIGGIHCWFKCAKKQNHL